LCITERGKLGLVPEGVAKGDRICVLVGAKAPFVVREVEGLDAEQEKYLLVSDCYIDGLMAGEGLRNGDVRDIELQEDVYYTAF
jgi:hypothetical protein